MCRQSALGSIREPSTPRPPRKSPGYLPDFLCWSMDIGMDSRFQGYFSEVEISEVESLSWKSYRGIWFKKEQTAFSVRGQSVNTFGFLNCRIAVVTGQLCCCVPKATVKDVLTSACVCLSRKTLYKKPGSSRLT